MNLFEPYRERHDRIRPSSFGEHLIRPALPCDEAELGAIAAAREGGSAVELATSIGRAITEWSRTREGIIVVAERKKRLVGFGKVHYFKPSDEAPVNVAPGGWYLAGLIVAPECRSQGVGKSLTRARLDWIGAHDGLAYYFANAQNRVTIDLHQQFGFVELTRNFTYPGATFVGGIGILFRALLSRVRDGSAAQPRHAADGTARRR